MKRLHGAILILALPVSAVAQVVPPAETMDQARARLSSALAASDAKATGPLIRRFDNWGDQLVVEVHSGNDREPVTAAIRAAHSALAREEKNRPLPADTIVNFTWNGMTIGPQFTRAGRFTKPLASMTAEQWFASMHYSGSSEKGMIGMVSWCRRGGSSQAPAICVEIKKSATDRNLWNAVGG